jgi:endo-1,4-beta-xylanase
MAPSLRDLADPYGLLIGSAVSASVLEKDPMYGEVIAREFNILTPENAMKFAQIHPARDRYDFTQADALVAFAEDNGMAVRGHTLVWDKDLPNWLTEGHYSRKALIRILREHIQTVVGHYRGQVAYWDVVNEAIDEQGGLQDGFWRQGIGPDYVEMAFQWTHEADPDALLFYNDYGAEGINPKSNAIFYYLGDLRQRGVPVDGIGFQVHTGLGVPPMDEVRANMERFGSLGMQVHITEMDVRIGPKVTQKKLRRQAEVYGDLLSMCLEVESCKAFEMWGVTDKYTWIPSVTGAPDAPLILDRNYWPKPAYNALWNILLGKP